jgi:hypothetical protein
MEHLNDSLLPLLGNLHEHMTFLADVGKGRDADLLGQIRTAWNNFVTSGQVWALSIGVIIGYLFKSLTSYG